MINSKEEVKITLPYLYKPRKYQINFLKAWDSGIKRLFWVVHRRAGKDKTVIANLPKRMMERVGMYYYMLPTYAQAKKVVWLGSDRDGMKFLDHFPKKLIKNVNQQEMIIELINGSMLQLVGADNIDRIVGTNPIGIVFSEYSLMKPEVWNFISPILRENGGWAVFVMTPRGTNHAYDLMNKIKDDKNWFVEVLTVDETQALTKEQLDEARSELPHDVFMQEYYVKFLDSGLGFFRRIDENIYKIQDYKKRQMSFFQMGVDLAKYQDYTVITPFNLNDFHVQEQESFNQMDYNLQKAKIENSYLRHNNPRVVIDSTGVGEPIYDDLKLRGLNIIPFRFNKSSRKDLLTNLQILLEQDKIKIPNDQVLIDELKSMTYELSDQGTAVIKVPDGKHDDRIMSLALAVWDIPPERLNTTPMNQTFESGGIEPFYDNLGY
jgi:hypothetical protein